VSAAKVATKATTKGTTKAQPKAAPKIEAADRDLGLPTTVSTRSTGQAARAVGELRRELVAAAGASAAPRGAPPALPTPIATFTI
jgi:hypothetical protein